MKRFVLALIIMFSVSFIYAVTPMQNGEGKPALLNELDEYSSIPHSGLHLDAIYEAPMLLSWFQDTTTIIGLSNGNIITIKPVELTNMYTGVKDYLICSSVSHKSGYQTNDISFLITKDEANSIVNALNCISNYVPNENISEIIHYEKLIPSYGVNIRFKFFYNNERKQWECFFITSASQSVVSTNNIGIHDGGFVVHGKLKDTWKGIYEIVCALCKGIKELDKRKLKYRERYIIEEEEDDVSVFYWNDIANIKEKKVEISIENLKKYYNEKEFYFNLNNEIYKIIKSNQIWLARELPKNYAVVEVDIDCKGKLLNPKLILKHGLNDVFSKRTIAMILDKISGFKITNYTNIINPEFHVTIPLRLSE